MSKEVQSLEDLPDEYPRGSKPIYSYHTLVRCAIQGSSNRPLTSEEIIARIERRFVYFRENKNGNCKTYLANTLANTPCFTSSSRGPLPTECYWEYDPSIDPQRRYSLAILSPPAAVPKLTPTPPPPPPPSLPPPSQQAPSAEALLLVQQMQEQLARDTEEEERLRKAGKKKHNKKGSSKTVPAPAPVPVPVPLPIHNPNLNVTSNTSLGAVSVVVTHTNRSADGNSDEKAAMATKFEPVRRGDANSNHSTIPKEKREVFIASSNHDNGCCIIC